MERRELKINDDWNLIIIENANGTVEPKIERVDGRGYSIEMVSLRGNGCTIPVIIEENGEDPCGQIVIYYYDDAEGRKVRVQKTQGVLGQIIALYSTSPSKDDMIWPSENFFQMSPKKIYGRHEVVVVPVDQKFAAENSGMWLKIQDFIEVCEDGPSLAALAKSGLLEPKKNIKPDTKEK